MCIRIVESGGLWYLPTAKCMMYSVQVDEGVVIVGSFVRSLERWTFSNHICTYRKVLKYFCFFFNGEGRSVDNWLFLYIVFEINIVVIKVMKSL